MNGKLTKLSQEYLVALRQHLESGSKVGPARATGLGRQAVALGLETLDLFRIHERALTDALAPGGSSRRRGRLVKQAKTFFTEAVTPIEKRHRAVRLADNEVDQLKRKLRQRTLELSGTTRDLRRGVRGREAAEEALKRSVKHERRLLQESRRLQKHLRDLTHRMLLAQEDERHQISRQLQGEILQMLLGIQVRLLALKQTARSHAGSLKKEVAGTRRLVIQSARVIHRFASEFGLHRAP